MKWLNSLDHHTKTCDRIHKSDIAGKSIRMGLLVLLMIFTLTHGATLSSTGVSIDPNTVNADSTLSLYSTLATIVPAGGRLVLTLPSTMSVSTATTLSCLFTEPSSLPIASCSNVGNVVTITLGTTQLSNSFFQVNILKVVNPPSTTPTNTFIFRTEDSSGTTLDQQTTNIL